jgi:lactoylglutathione lyase
VRLRIELFPSDIDASIRFWTGVMGFEVVRDDRRAAPPYAHLARGEVRVGLLEDTASAGNDPRRRPPDGVEVVLEVDDVVAERDRVVTAGWRLDADLTERPWGLTDFRLLDPDGYYLRVTDRGR